MTRTPHSPPAIILEGYPGRTPCTALGKLSLSEVTFFIRCALHFVALPLVGWGLPPWHYAEGLEE